MLDPHQLTNDELFWIVALVALIGYELFQVRAHPRAIEMFRPTIILAVILSYYALIGPLRAVALGEWLDRGLDRRNDMILGWAGATVFYASTLIGFHLLGSPSVNRRRIGPVNPKRLHKLGTTLCQIGLVLFSVVAGARLFAYINPFTARELLANTSGASIFGGEGINNYFLLAINFLIPGVCLLFTNWAYNRDNQTQLLFWLLVAVGIFTTLGFRFRLVLLAVPMIMIYYLVRKTRPNLIVVSVALVGLIFMAGFVGLTRTYGQGLNTSELAERSSTEIFEEGLGGESQVFLTTSGMIAITPTLYPYVGVQPFISILQYPIPSAWFPEKDIFGYLQRAIATLYDDPMLGSGAALLCYGEWYLMAGWPSVILMSLLLGWLLRCLWNWLLIRQEESLALTIYALTVSYLYLVVSRGYMAQVVAGALSTLGPMYWIYRRWSRPVLPLRDIPSAPSLPRG